jgi:hypothetical protein
MVWLAPSSVARSSVEVDRDDRVATDRLGRHQRAEPDRAEPKDDDPFAGLRLEDVEHTACAGLQPAAERTQDLERKVVGHLHRVVHARDRMGGKGRLAEPVAVHIVLALMHRHGAVQACAEVVQRREQLAVRGPLSLTQRTLAAVIEAERDVVADG